MKPNRHRTIHRHLSPQKRAEDAREWRQWRKRNPASARSAYLFLRDFKLNLMGGDPLDLERSPPKEST